MEQNKDKDWLGLQFTQYEGPKLRLAVMQVENKTAHLEQMNEAAAGDENTYTVMVNPQLAQVPIGSIEELLTTALYNSHRFELVERKALQAVLNEQDLGESGRISPPTASQVGRTLGARYQIFAAVNEWTPVKSKAGGGGLGALGGILGGASVSKKKAEITMSFRVVDTSSA